jgi:hypothetical protein
MKVKSHDVIQFMKQLLPVILSCVIVYSFSSLSLHTATGSLVDTKRIVQVAGRVQTTVFISSFVSVKGIRETFEEKQTTGTLLLCSPSKKKGRKGKNHEDHRHEETHYHT